jgi:ribose transport system permease protein
MDLKEKIRIKNGIFGKALKFIKIPQIGILIPLIILIGIFGGINPTFFSPLNLANIFRTMSYTGLIACGMTMLMISGEIDLSVGSVAGFGSLITGIFLHHLGINFILAILIGVIAGMVIGFINGILSVKIKIPSLIATLGMLYLARGGVYVITNGAQVYPLGEAFNNFGKAEPLGVGWSFVILLIFLLVSDQLLRMTAYGKSLYAIGGNIQAAKVAGINTDRRKISVFIFSSALAALSGILLSARITTVTPIIGEGWELQVIAAVVIGGTSVLGGIGSITGTLIGALIMAVVKNGMVLVGINPQWQTLVIGLIMIIAVGVDVFRRSKIK